MGVAVEQGRRPGRGRLPASRAAAHWIFVRSLSTAWIPASPYHAGVRGYHLDGYGHVNNARYLEFLEEGAGVTSTTARRWRSCSPRASMRSLRSTNIDYRRAAVAGDDLEVITQVAGLGSRSARMHQVIRRCRDGKSVVDADLTLRAA
ncbi:hypothetical protein DSL92_08630 [Billgrantia gudaonensis]|uniref:Thioesterase domain-containing protein n=1 Tax=Billgrantia gudaonensis TaxID=376427 RepID=A0A3S0Q0R4_9GAMM|nr:hypothetical protein DSL92_08630 [Halomonas gudaonensis]